VGTFPFVAGAVSLWRRDGNSLSSCAVAQGIARNNTLSSSLRFRWEYRPGSELFVVYSDGRDTSARGFPTLQNRTVALKHTRLFRY
jgi:hypothetical protein